MNTFCYSTITDTTTIKIYCDARTDCGSKLELQLMSHDVRDWEAAMRRVAKEKGWGIVKVYNVEKDFCPECVALWNHLAAMGKGINWSIEPSGSDISIPWPEDPMKIFKL